MFKALIIILAYLIYLEFLLPVVGEYNFMRYNRTSNIAYLERAIKYDPNTMYLLTMAQKEPNIVAAKAMIKRAIEHTNGDSPAWSLWTVKGQLDYKTGMVLEAKDAFERAVYYNPTIKELGESVAALDDIINKYDKIQIKIK